LIKSWDVTFWLGGVREVEIMGGFVSAGKPKVRDDSDGRVPSVSGRKAKRKEKKGVTVRFD
jgi:hypothetical protein